MSTLSPRLLLICGLFITLLQPVSSNELRAQSNANDRLVEVTGDGEVLVAPNAVLFELGVETLKPELDASRRENDKRVSAVLDLLRSSGIDDKYIQTDFVQVEPEYIYKDDEEPVFRGYTVTKSIMVTLHDLTKLETLIASLLQSGITNIRDYSLRTTEFRKYRDEARLLALKAAREKAEAAANALGQKIGRPIRITELPDVDVPFSSNLSAGYEALISGQTFAHGRIGIHARVQVSFALE
jgi:uncharacterized protein YggE